MGSPRKSKRLLQQQLEKREYTVKLRAAVSGRHSDGSDEGLSCREEETEVLGEQPLISVNTTPRTNNFIKVHSSYNKDRGCSSLDVYEGDFIDDSYRLRGAKRKKTKRDSARSCATVLSSASHNLARRRLSSESDDDDDGIGRSKQPNKTRREKVVLSTDDEDYEAGMRVAVSDSMQTHKSIMEEKDKDNEEAVGVMQLRKRKRKTQSGRRLLLEDSDEEEEEKEEERKRSDQQKRKAAKTIKPLESDEDMELQPTPSRLPSSRVSKLQQCKNMKRTELLGKLQKAREGCSSSESEEVSDGGGLKNVGRVGSELERNTCTELDAEQILFPESDGEESDWIVNDLEEVQMDVTLELGDADDQQTDTEGCHSVCLAGTTEPDSSTEKWMRNLTRMKIFPPSVTSTAQPSEIFDTLLKTNSPNHCDEHGLYPLIYAAALANEAAVKQLLPHTAMEGVRDVLSTHSTTLLNIIVEAPLRKREKGSIVEDDDVASLKCLEALFSFNKKAFQDLLDTDGTNCPTTLAVAVWSRKPLCVHYLLQNSAPIKICFQESNSSSLSPLSPLDSQHYTSPTPSVLHLAVMENDREQETAGERDGGVAVLEQLLPKLWSQLEDTDHLGYTPLMTACAVGDVNSLTVLLHYGASMSCRDSQNTSPLHLAALSGWRDCIRVLIEAGHPVGCLDSKGWPPLLYAHFQDHQDCVLELMKAKPQQLSMLSGLLERNRDSEGWILTVKVVRSLLVSLAHHETYHAMFNQFVRENPLVLEEREFGFLKHCMGLLDFRNKLNWIKRKLNSLRTYAKEMNITKSLSLVSLPRSPPQGLLACVQDRLSPLLPTSCWLNSVSVTFNEEAGICTGPRREFWSLYCQELASGKDCVFTTADNGQLKLQPGIIFLQHSPQTVPHLNSTAHLAERHHVGMMLAQAVFHGDNIPIRLSPPLLKQLLGIALSHPDDLEQVDQSLFHNLTQCQDISELDLTFSDGLQCPWNGLYVEVPLLSKGSEKSVTTEDQDEFVQLISEFKLERSVTEETKSFCAGFWKVIPQKCLQVFTANELSLFLSGVPSIDMDDWEKHTKCAQGMSEDTIVWFWRLVRSLKEEEKALLLKFATGSPCVPAGGFQNLQGLHGPTPFSIQEFHGMDKIPKASTCFNSLKLSSYSSEQELRDKILIAIRFGCEGFEFS